MSEIPVASGLLVAHIGTGAHSLTLIGYASDNAAAHNTESAATTYTVVVVLEVVDEQLEANKAREEVKAIYRKSLQEKWVQQRARKVSEGT